MQVGYVNVNLRLCRRCHDAEKALKTDLYFVNILDYSSNIRETLCYGCIGAIVNENENDNNCDIESADDWMSKIAAINNRKNQCKRLAIVHLIPIF